VGTLVKGGLLANFKSTLVRPQESIAETQPQLHPVLLSLLAIIPSTSRDEIMPFLISTPITM
jgi:hypothetical protein